MIPFTKAHACGNDFLIVTEDAAAGFDRTQLSRSLCARNTGIGADGVEFFAWTGAASGRIRLHNADGSIAEISGNGTRCVAAWMALMVESKAGDELRIATDAGVRICHVNAINRSAGFSVDVTTNMGIPIASQKTVSLSGGRAITGTAVSTGNPHFVIVVDNTDFAVDGEAWQSVGAEICMHPDFPHQTNVEFVRIANREEMEIRIFERGVGPTTSSGTGSSASAAAAMAFHGCATHLRVVAPGGAQTVHWRGPDSELELTGPAALIARGEAFAE